jgi:hypothetical protein
MPTRIGPDGVAAPSHCFASAIDGEVMECELGDVAQPPVRENAGKPHSAESVSELLLGARKRLAQCRTPHPQETELRDMLQRNMIQLRRCCGSDVPERQCRMGVRL